MLRKRIISAIIALTLLLGVLFYLPPDAARLVIAGVFMAAAWEWSGFLGLPNTPSRLVFVALIAALEFVCWNVVPATIHYEFILYIAVAWWFAALCWTFFFPTAIPAVVGWLCGVLVLIPAYVALDWLYLQSPKLLLFMLTIVWAADIGAYFIGRKLGRVKLAPAISPGKTWEGVFGGIAAVTIVALLGSLWSDASAARVIPFCISVALLSIVGDLTVSMFKRHAGVKDSGRLFPGHGGLLDRIDSVTAAAPLFAAGVALAGLH